MGIPVHPLYQSRLHRLIQFQGYQATTLHPLCLYDPERRQSNSPNLWEGVGAKPRLSAWRRLCVGPGGKQCMLGMKGSAMLAVIEVYECGMRWDNRQFTWGVWRVLWQIGFTGQCLPWHSANTGGGIVEEEYDYTCTDSCEKLANWSDFCSAKETGSFHSTANFFLVQAPVLNLSSNAHAQVFELLQLNGECRCLNVIQTVEYFFAMCFSVYYLNGIPDLA